MFPGVQGMEEPGYPREGCQAAKASLRDGDFRVQAQDWAEEWGRAGRGRLFEDGAHPRLVLRLRGNKKLHAFVELRRDSIPTVCGGRVGVWRGQGDLIGVRSAGTEHKDILALGREMEGDGRVTRTDLCCTRALGLQRRLKVRGAGGLVWGWSGEGTSQGQTQIYLVEERTLPGLNSGYLETPLGLRWGLSPI